MTRLQEAIKRVLPACSRDDTRTINRVIIEPSGAVVATDGHRIHVVEGAAWDVERTVTIWRPIAQLFVRDDDAFLRSDGTAVLGSGTWRGEEPERMLPWKRVFPFWMADGGDVATRRQWVKHGPTVVACTVRKKYFEEALRAAGPPDTEVRIVTCGDREPMILHGPDDFRALIMPTVEGKS